MEIREISAEGAEAEGIKPENGYFIRDFETDTVICPAGATLTRKCTKSNGYIRYMKKAACSHCNVFRKCYGGKGKWKEIDFPDGAEYVACRNWIRKDKIARAQAALENRKK